ncbi:MAG: hypothetical protein WCS03_12950, partial [Bacteroidota bacterium]
MKFLNILKPLALTISLLLSASLIKAQRTASVTGNWSSTATWGGLSVPSSTDGVLINSGIVVTVDVNATCYSLTFATNTSTVSTAGLVVNTDFTLTVIKAVSFPKYDTGIKNNCTWSISGSGSLSCGTMNIGSNQSPEGSATTTITVNSSLANITVAGELSEYSYFTGSGSKSNNATFNISGGTFNAGGTITTNNMSSSTSTISLTNATLNLSAATPWSLSVNGTSTMTLNGAGATVNYKGAAQTGLVNTYNNLTLSGSLAKTFSTTPTVNGILSLEGTATIAVTTGVVAYGPSATLQYKTTNIRTITSKEWITPFAATGGVIISNTGTITLNEAKVVNAPLIINSGATLNTSAVNNYQLTFGGNFSNSGIFTANASPVTFSGASSQTISGFTTTGLVSMAKTGNTATLTGNVNGAGLTINGSGGTLNLGTNLTNTFTGNITLTAGTLNGGSSTLNDNSTSTTAWGGTGSLFVAGTGTVNFGGVAQMLSASVTSFNNLTFSNSGIKTFSSNTAITGAFTVASGVVANLGTGLSHTAGTLILGPDGKTSGTWGGTGGLYLTNPVTYINTTYFATSTGGVSVSGSSCIAGSWNGSASTDWNTATNWCDGTIPNASTNVVIPSGGNQPVIGAAAVCNSLTINSGATLAITESNALTVSGNWLNNGSFTANSSTVNFNGTTQTISGSNTTFNNLTISNSGVVTFTTIPNLNSILSMEGTATVSTSPTYGAAASLQYNTATARTAGAEWLTTFAATGGVIIANTGTITLNAAKVFNALVPLTINNNATLATGNFEVDLGGNFVNSGSFSAGSSPIVITNTATQSIGGFTTTGLVSMTKTAGTATFTGNVNGAGMTINGSGGSLNLGTSLTHSFTGNWALTAGTVLGNTSTLNIGGNGTADGTFTVGTSTVNYNASSIQTVAPLTYNNLSLSGSNIKTTTGVTVNGILSMEGTATASAVPTYGGAATLQYKGSNAQSTGPEFPATWSGTGGIKIENANGTGVTLNSITTINNSSLTIGGSVSNSIFNDGGKQITASGNTTLNLNSGTFKLGSATVATTFPVFSGTPTIATGTTVEYASTFAVQTVSAQTYSNLTISGTGTYNKVAGGDITVNGMLTISTNPSSGTIGSLDMSTSYILNMGTSATTLGLGDVTGIVKRTNASFADNTPYSFGNQYTTVTFIGISGGTRPGWLSCKIAIGTAPVWKATAANRVYSFAQEATGTDQVITNIHYLDTELHGSETDETKLVLWDAHGGTPWSGDIESHGKSNNDATANWIGLSGLNIYYLAPSTVLDNKQWGLSYSGTTKNTWNGTSTAWDLIANWNGGHVPLLSEDVLIPAGKSYYPVLALDVEVKTLEIESGASVNPGAYNITINGFTGALLNNGTLTPGTGSSAVNFTHTPLTDVVSISGTGTNNFNNINVSATAYLQPASGSHLKIAGTLTVASGGIIDLKATNNTVEYNGSGQSIVNLQGPSTDIGYSNLVISGTIETLPATLNVMRDFTVSGESTNAAASSTISILGNVALSAGAFDASSAAINVGGNWTNNGATFTPGTGTVTFNNTTSAQSINGTAASQTFYNLVVAKTAQELSVGGSTTSLTVNNLTQTSGNFTAPATLTVNGTTLLTAGTFTAGSATTTLTGDVTLTAGTYVPGITTNLSGNLTNNGATFTDETGTVNLNGSSARTIGGTTSNTFNNVTVNNTAGITATVSQTVNGVLNLPAANASATKGSLDMGANTLNMGATATTTGTGDVTGIVTRNSFTTGASYTFGNQFTTLNMQAGGTLPGSVSFKIVLSNSWKTSGIIDRYYDIIQTGGDAATFATLNLHYLSGELNGTTEGNSDLFDHDISPPLTEDQGSSNYNITNKWVGLANLSLTYIAPSAFGVKFWTIGTSTHSGVCTWSASANSTTWNDAGNWTGGIPSTVSNVIIPSGKSYYPVLPASTTINSINIQSGGTLTGGT